jgi:hypothetical protein
VKVYWTAFYGRSEYTFQGRNAKRDAQRLVKRFGGRVVREKGNQRERQPMKHAHKPKHFVQRCFSGPVDSHRPNPRAHGWTTVEQTCRCGSTRLVNVNQRQKETGYWQEG